MLPILFLAFFALMAVGAPIAIALGASTLLTLVVNGHTDMLLMLPQKMMTALDSFPLMAVPLFILTGQLMNNGGITRRIVRLSNVIVGHVRGGLSHVNVVASMIFAGISGSATADTAGIGSVLIPAMIEDGYEEDWAVGITAASSTIGPIIPPSILMVIYGFMTQLSIAKLFLVGLVPGIIIGLALIAAGYILAVKRGQARKARASLKQMLLALKDGWPPLLAPLIIIGGITTGVFTATEAGVIAALYALILGLVYRELNFRNLIEVVFTSAVNTTVVLFIVACASSFGWVIGYEQLPMTLVGILNSITTNPHLMLFLILVVMLLLGMVMEGMVMLLVFVPVFIPLANVIGLDPYHFALLMIVCIEIGGLTPPVGLLLYIACGVSHVPIRRVTRLVWYFVAVMVVVLLLLAYVPGLATWLPDKLLK